MVSNDIQSFSSQNFHRNNYTTAAEIRKKIVKKIKIKTISKSYNIQTISIILEEKNKKTKKWSWDIFCQNIDRQQQQYIKNVKNTEYHFDNSLKNLLMFFLENCKNQE